MKLFWHFAHIGKRFFPQYLLYSILYAEQTLKNIPRFLEISMIDYFIYKGTSTVSILPNFCVILVDFAIYHKINESYSIRIRPGDSLYGILGNKWNEIYNHKLNDIFRKKFPNPNIIAQGNFITLPDEDNYSYEWIIKYTKLYEICRYLKHQTKHADLLYLDSSCIYDIPQLDDSFIFGKDGSIDCFFCPQKYAEELYFDLINQKIEDDCVGPILFEKCKKNGKINLFPGCSKSFSRLEDIKII